MWGTAGNLSIRLRSDPLEIAITPSGVNKGRLSINDLITVKDSPHPALPASRQAPAIRQTAGGQGPALALQGEVAKPTGDSPDVWRGGAARVRVIPQGYAPPSPSPQVFPAHG